jgi:hypothetical protein
MGPSIDEGLTARKPLIERLPGKEVFRSSLGENCLEGSDSESCGQAILRAPRVVARWGGLRSRFDQGVTASALGTNGQT